MNSPINIYRQMLAKAFLIARASIALHQYELNANPTVSISQNPTVTVTSSNLSGGAGTDLTPALSSSSMVLGMSISGATTTNGVLVLVTNWYGYCSLGSSSGNWPSNLVCSVKLLSAGSSNATSSTNGTYTTLTSSPQMIFQGSGNGTGITLQCQLTNLSLTNCPPTSSTATLPIVVTLQSA